jgi:mannose-1-phosphate guanylyltransferase/phosphomannomutase
MMSVSGVKISDVIARIAPGRTGMTEIPCPWNRKGRVMRRLIDFTNGMKRDTIDGVRVVLDDRWVMVAPDRQRASFYLIAEAPTEDDAAKLLEEYRRMVIQWRDTPDGITNVVSQ